MWNERYAEPGYAYGSEPNDFLVSVVDRLPPGPVLCLAEGEGRNAVFLATRGRSVTAVDGSEVGLTKAAALAGERGVALTSVVSDLADYVILPGAWAVIVSIWCHLPAALRQRVHREVVAGLSPGGMFVLEAYTPAQLAFDTGGPKRPEMLADLGGLRTELDGLDWLVAEEREREVHEGRCHTGRSAVVQLLGQKPRAHARAQ